MGTCKGALIKGGLLQCSYNIADVSFYYCDFECKHRDMTDEQQEKKRQQRVKELQDDLDLDVCDSERERLPSAEVDNLWAICKACDAFKTCRRCHSCRGYVYRKPLFKNDKCPKGKF